MESQVGRDDSPEGVVYIVEIAKGRTCVKGIVGHDMRVCYVLSLYGYAYPRRKVREGLRIIWLFPRLMAFERPIDEG